MEGSAVLLDFDPARDGFGFSNHFVWTDDDLNVLSRSLHPWASGALGVVGSAVGAVRGRRGAAGGGLLGTAVALGGGGDRLVRTIARRWSSFGLCGGMALAAVERWPAAGRVSTSDLERDHLRPLLRRRQEATLRAALSQFARYWARVRFTPGAMPEAPLAALLERELDAIEARLRAGRPVVLGLVGDAPDPFALHQVVGYGLDRTGPISGTITVYDPNAPGQSRTITTAPGRAPRRTRIETDLLTGPRKGGGAHVSTRAGHLSHVFVIDPAAKAARL